MDEQIKDLIYSIASGDALDSENKLNSILAQKTISALDDMRLRVANSMFNSEAPQEE